MSKRSSSIADVADNLGVEAPINSPVVDSLIATVDKFALRKTARHTLVAGGFGAGKTYALTQAVQVAKTRGLRVASLRRGPLGISSYADFLVAVAKETPPANQSLREVDSWRQELSSDELSLDLAELERRVFGDSDYPGLVLVIESLDQLLHQLRSSDRPRLVELLFRGSPHLLILGSVHGNGLAEELGSKVLFLQTVDLPTMAAATAHALQEARRLGASTPKFSARLAREASRLDPTITSNWLFWSLVGRYLVVARSNPLRWAEEDLLSRMASHFDAMLLTLAPSEQRVLLALAEAGGPRTVGQVAATIGVRNQAAATALGRLLSDDWVSITELPSEPDRRRTWYDIADPMLRRHLSGN